MVAIYTEHPYFLQMGQQTYRHTSNRIVIPLYRQKNEQNEKRQTDRFTEMRINIQRHKQKDCQR
jgi:hypothetical protein